MGNYIKEVEEKHFLMRQLQNHYITEEEYNEKVKPLNLIIQTITLQRLEEARAKIIPEIQEVKKTIKYDGEMKRGVGKILIDFLKEDFTNEELKGIFRQSYKIMRKNG